MDTNDLLEKWDEYLAFRSSNSGYELVLSFIDREAISLSAFFELFKSSDDGYNNDLTGVVLAFQVQMGFLVGVADLRCFGPLNTHHPKSYLEHISIYQSIIGGKFLIERYSDPYYGVFNGLKMYKTLDETLDSEYDKSWKNFKMKRLNPEYTGVFEKLMEGHSNNSFTRGFNNDLPEASIPFWYE
jgi:hypothetical protein